MHDIDKIIEEQMKRWTMKTKSSQKPWPVISISREFGTSGAALGENIANHFEVIISANETSYPKPNPETYIKVLEDVNNSEQINPEEVVVIEDTPKGVTAAKLAQMKTIGITNAVESSRLSEADKIVSDYLEINEELIDSL